MHYQQLSKTALEGIWHFAVDLTPSSFCYLLISGGRKNLYSHLHLTRMKRKNSMETELQGHTESVIELILEHRLPKSGLQRWQSLYSPSWVLPLPDQMLLSSYCVSAGGWQCCWLLSGSVWALLFHPLIKSCTFLIGEQNLQKRKKNPPFQNIQGLKFIWLWNAHQGLTA